MPIKTVHYTKLTPTAKDHSNLTGLILKAFSADKNSSLHKTDTNCQSIKIVKQLKIVLHCTNYCRNKIPPNAKRYHNSFVQIYQKSFFYFKFVANSPNCFERPLFRHALKLFSEPFYMNINCAAIAIIVETPNLVQKLVSSVNSVRI